jgi:hypothetical protein
MTTIRRARILGAVGACAILIAGTPVAGAHHSYDHDSIDVIATGLNAPRGLDFGPGGVLFVAEAGAGGDGPCFAGPEGDEVCFGLTGAITAIRGDEQWQAVTGLPSLADEDHFGVTGPHDVAWSAFGVVATVGLGADPADRDPVGAEGAALGTVVRADHRGAWKVGTTAGWESIADLAAFEAAEFPQQGSPTVEHPDSNPFGLAVHGGEVVVADAGGNTVVRFDQHPPNSGAVSLVTLLPFGSAEAPPFLGLPPGAQLDMQPVPTGIVRHGGSYYVGQLTGFPFPVGGASVYRVAKGQDPVEVAGGFTNIIDIAFDKKGRLLVLEMFTNGLLSGDLNGALWRVERDGSKTVVADGSDGLLAPAGVTVGTDGAYYVSNKGVGHPGAGEVLRIQP